MDNFENRVNLQIRAKEVLLIDDNGINKGVLPFREAYRIAQESGLDLMEVNSRSNPPICKLLDYGKFKYEKKKQASEHAKKNKPMELKEIQLHTNTGANDLSTKLGQIANFLKEGNRVKVSIRFRGGEIRHTHLGMEKLEDIFKYVTENKLGSREYKPSLEGKQLHMILIPN